MDTHPHTPSRLGYTPGPRQAEAERPAPDKTPGNLGPLTGIQREARSTILDKFPAHASDMTAKAIYVAGAAAGYWEGYKRGADHEHESLSNDGPVARLFTACMVAIPSGIALGIAALTFWRMGPWL